MDFDPKELFKTLKEKDLLIPIGIVVVVVILFIILGPRISGYMAYNTQLDDCEDDLAICEEDRGNLSNTLTTTNTELESAKNTILEQNQTFTDLEIQYKAEIYTSIEQRDNITIDFNELGKNSANNICCKMKYDNPDIDSYDIVDNKISCSVDGGNSLSCSF